MAVTAKFKVSRTTPGVAGGDTVEVELTPDYAQGKNAEWAVATPAGVIRLTITNPAALEQFTDDPEHSGVVPYDKQRSFTVTFEEEA